MTRRPSVGGRAAVVGYVGVILLTSAGAAAGLAGSNTVFSDDIVDGQVAYGDIRDNAMTGKKILDNSVTGVDIRDEAITSADVKDDSLTGDDLASASVGRSELAFNPIADVVKASVSFAFASNQSTGVTAPCPVANPVVLGGGFVWGSAQPGFVLWASRPVNGGWRVDGQNALPQSNALTVYAICASG